MTVVVEDADKNDADLYIGRYSIETKEAQEFAIESFTAISDEARLVVDEDCIVYMYCTLDEQGELKINIELYDYKNNTSKLLSTNYVYNVFGYAKKLNEKELVFFFYESVSSNTQQVILHYDLESEKLNEIYRGNNIVGYNDNSTSTKDIWAIDTSNGNIELLMQQLVDGKMVFYLCTLNNQGTVIQETKLDALSQYDSIEDTADSLVVKGNYLFIHYSQYNKSEKNSNAPFSILYKENNEYHLLKTEDSITPKNICGSKASDMPYVVYRSYESENELFVFNVDTGERFLLDIDRNEIGNSWVDQAGNLLVATRTEDKTNWYFYASDNISEKLIR